MHIAHRVFAIAMLAGVFHIAGVAAQTYPTKPIRLIVPSTPGGSVDTLARSVGTQMSQRWSQQVLIDNRSGAGGIIAAEATAKSAPDGYTLIMATVASIATNISLVRNLPYDPVRDFTPVSLVATQQLMLLIHPGIAAKSVAELTQLAKANPGKLTFASAGSGTGSHLSGELYKMLAGINLVHVPYKGVGPSFADMLSGRISMGFASVLSGTPHFKAGKLRGLAVTGVHHSVVAPDLPTMAEAGVAGYEASTWYGMLGPKGLPQPLLTKINAEVVAILRIPEVKERIISEGAEPVGSSPEEFGEFIKAEIAKWAKVIKAAGITPE